MNGNVTFYNGGGVANYGGTLTGLNSTIAGNFGVSGGGVWNSGTLTVRNSTITDNDALYQGGGIWNGGRLTLVRTTLTGNMSGFYSEPDDLYSVGPVKAPLTIAARP